MSPLHREYGGGMSNEQEEFLQIRQPMNQRLNTTSRIDRQMQMRFNGIPTLQQPTDAELHTTQFLNQSPFANYTTESRCGNYYDASNPVIPDSGVSPFAMSGRSITEQVRNTDFVMDVWNRGFLTGAPSGAESEIRRTASPPLAANPVQQFPAHGVGRFPPSMIPVGGPWGRPPTRADQRRDAQGASRMRATHSGLANARRDRDYAARVVAQRHQMQNAARRMAMRRNHDAHASAMRLQRVDSLTMQREHQMQLQQNSETLRSFTQQLPHGFQGNPVMAQHPLEEDVYPFTQEQDSHEQEFDLGGLFADRSNRAASILPPSTMRKYKKELSVLLLELKELISYCCMTIKEKHDRSYLRLLKGLKASQLMLQRAMDRDQWETEFARTMDRLIKDSKYLIKGAKLSKQQQSSRLSNSTTTWNNQYMESDDIINQESTNLSDNRVPPMMEDRGFENGSQTMNSTKREAEILPEESTNHHPSTMKQQHRDNMVILDNADKSTHFQSHSSVQKTPPINQLKNQTKTSASHHQSIGVPEGCLNNKARPSTYKEGTSKDIRRKRESVQDTSTLHERGARRRIEQTKKVTSISPPFFPDANTLGKKGGEIEEDRGSNDGVILNKHSEKDKDKAASEFITLDHLFDEVGNIDSFWPQMECCLEDNYQEWKFDRKVLGSISSTWSLLPSSSSLTNKTFLSDELVEGDNDMSQELPAHNSPLMQKTKDDIPVLETDFDAIELLGRVKLECDELVKKPEYSGEFTCNVSISDQSPDWKDSCIEQEAIVLLKHMKPSKVCSDIKLTVNASYPETAPSISFNNALTDVGSLWLRSSFLHKVADLELTSVKEILQLWSEHITVESSNAFSI
eukprot:g2906.t1